MRQSIKFLLTFFIFGIICLSSFAYIKSSLEYNIPVDYTKLNEAELQEKAGFYYNLALKSCSLNEEMTTALNLYTILSHKNPKNIIYLTRLGELYDILGKDRYAKGAFFDAIGIDSSRPEPYFYLGEFYYKRNIFKKALKMYKKAYLHGYTRHYDTLFKIGDIYEKLGDTEAALKYLQLASQINPNSELDNKIKRTENANQLNKEYYSDTRIRINER